MRAARFALRRGLELVALCGADCDNTRHGRSGHASTARGKVPLFCGWTSSRIRSVEDIPAGTGNVGIITGLSVDVLDIDCEAGLAWATATQPETPWRVMTGAGCRQHWYYKRRTDEKHTGMVLSLPEGKSLHFRGENALVVAPHCFHYSGRQYVPVGDWGVKLADLPLFNRQEAEKIRGMQGVKRREEALANKAAHIARGELPPSGMWSESEVEELLAEAHEKMLPRHRSLVFRKNRYADRLAARKPCRAGAAGIDALEMLRMGIVYLLIPVHTVLDMLSTSDWAVKATEADGVTPWPWTRAQLADRVDRMLAQTWRSRYGFWVQS
jgi:hypothetical protein